nr:ABC transporter permease [uncultured Merdimonas sp.]
MTYKLAFRNVRRSARDYLVYFLTMTFVTALMFAFNTVIFSERVGKMFEVAGLMAGMIGMATFFIVLIIAWLINYMVQFILEKRSREFGLYLLIGMRKKEVARLYLRESLLMGTAAFCLGLLLGFLLQQILLAILYGMLKMDQPLGIEWNGWCFLMTFLCYFGCYFLALFRCKRRFRKMNIRDLMDAQHRGEEIREGKIGRKKVWLPVSLLALALLEGALYLGFIRDGGSIAGFLVGLVVFIYLFYVGISAWVVGYVRKKGDRIYHNGNLFLLRQFASKVRTMQFTMGTLTALFTVAILGCTVALMFQDYQEQILQGKFPFDVQVYGADPADDFGDELEILKKETTIKESYIYRIYENETDAVNVWLYSHLQVFGGRYQKKDGTPDVEKIRKGGDGSYCRYDTYMGLSDYNALRKMLGYEEVSLENGEYLLHMKDRVLRETGDFTDEIKIQGKDGVLACVGIRTEPFSQDGHNGGDYVIVVPDEELSSMTPYYSELAVDIKGKAPDDLEKQLDSLGDEQDFGEHPQREGNSCYGSDTIVSYAAVNLVRDNLIPEVRYMLLCIMFPAFYIGLVFLCVALTVLSVQQLSDAAKYRFRYRVLGQLGMGRKETDHLIFRQLLWYYLCPALFAAAVSSMICAFISRKFIFYTGVHTPLFQYFGASCLLFLGIYTVYFVITYISFKRTVREENGR